MFRVIRYGGSIGEVNHPYECATKEEAQAKAKAWILILLLLVNIMVFVTEL